MPAQAGPCYVVPDERAALDAEIGRLQADSEKIEVRAGEIQNRSEKSKTELEKLKAELGGRVSLLSPAEIDEALPKSDPLKKPEPNVAEGSAPD